MNNIRIFSKFFGRSLLYPALFGVLLLLFGVFVSGFYDLYYKWSHLDTLYHFLGGFVLGWFFYILLFARQENENFSKGAQLFVVVSTVCFAGVFWEYAERLSTIYASVHAPWFYHWFSGGNLNDTLLDLLADMLGGAVFFGFFRNFLK